MRHKPWRVHRVGSWWPRTKISWYLGNSKHLEQQNKMFPFSWLSSARICPWLWCTPSPFPSGNSFILQVSLCLSSWDCSWVLVGGKSTFPLQVCVLIVHSAWKFLQRYLSDMFPHFFQVSVPIGPSQRCILCSLPILTPALISLLDAFFFKDTNITWFSLSHIHTHPYLPTYLSSISLSMQILVCNLHENVSFMGRVKT